MERMEKQTAVEWTPKNGERVWIKVFSNWSLGTYVGFDTIENKHIVREDADGGGHLMASSQVLPEDENPNVPKQPTAVEWLEKEMQKTYIFNQDDFDMFNQAKAMEKEQKIEFAEKYANSDSFYCSGEFDIEKGAEQYYNETFKSK